MDPEQEVREYQREYLDFLDDEVSFKYTLGGNKLLQIATEARHLLDTALPVGLGSNL